jgi:hypothetical protein
MLPPHALATVHRAALLIVLGLLLVVVAVAIGWRTRRAPLCAPLAQPSMPVGLVLRVDRLIVPIGAELVHESGQVTFDGACAADSSCHHVSIETMRHLYQLVRNTGRARHRDVYTSPHYGARWITADAPSGRCEIADGSQAPIDPADEPAFYAAFDAIIQAYLAN